MREGAKGQQRMGENTLGFLSPTTQNGNLEGRGEKSSSAMATYHWHGLTLQLPAALRLAKWCDLQDKVLEFRASHSSLQEGFRALESANLGLQYDIVDGALWVKMSSSQYTDMLPGPLDRQLALWEKRNGMEDEYIVSGSSGMVYINNFPKMLIPDCCIFETRTFAARREIDARQGRVVPIDLQAEVAFECVSATDDVEKIWLKCKRHVVSNRAKMAVGICDRNDKKEVLIVFRDIHGDVQSEVKQDPRFISFDRVLKGFRLYFSYMMPTVFMYFTRHHVYDLRLMKKANRQTLLCTQVLQGGQASGALAEEIMCGLGTLDFHDAQGRTPLVCAAHIGDRDIVEFILNNGGRVDWRDVGGVCPLLAAIAEGRRDIVSLLRNKGATIDLSIHAVKDAVDRGEIERLRCLLKASVNVNEVNTGGMTALMHAVLSRKVDGVKVLVSQGASPTLADPAGLSALDYAKIVREQQIISILEEAIRSA